MLTFKYIIAHYVSQKQDTSLKSYIVFWWVMSITPKSFIVKLFYKFSHKFIITEVLGD